jgi:hypothetical protein
MHHPVLTRDVAYLNILLTQLGTVLGVYGVLRINPEVSVARKYECARPKLNY